MPINHMQNKLVQQQMHNEQVNKNLNQIEHFAAQHSGDDIISWLKQWQGSDQLSMTNPLFWTLIACSVMLAGLLIAFSAPAVSYLLVIALAGFAFYKKASNKQRNTLCDQLASQRLEEKYQLKFNQNALSVDIEQLIHMFPLFNLGNYDNEIRQTAAAIWSVDGQEYPVTLFQYHYVDKEERRENDGRTSTSYHHYDRWGIFVGNLSIRGITISTHQKGNCRLGTKWTSSDIAFNRRYQLSGQSEIALARFFSPSRVLLMDQVLADYEGDFYIHPQIPILCWQFKKDLFATTPKSYRANNISELVQMLESLTLHEYEHLRKNLIPLIEKLD